MSPPANTGGKDERTEHRLNVQIVTKNAKAHNRTTQKKPIKDQQNGPHQQTWGELMCSAKGINRCIPQCTA